MYKWSAEMLEKTRKYSWGNMLPFIFKYIEMKKNSLIVDVGCGSGFFARAFATQTKNIVVGIDLEKTVLKEGEKYTRKFNVHNIFFLQGDAYRLPLKSNIADVVICEFLLWSLKEPYKCLEEMKRVCKKGGTLVCIESDKGGEIIYSTDKRLLKLERKYKTAYIKGWKRKYGADACIGSKLPSMFIELGLKNIDVSYNLIWSVCGLPPWRHHDPKEKKELYEWVKKEFEKNYLKDLDIASKGGMKKDEFNELRKIQKEKLDYWIKKIDGYLDVTPCFIVKGRKQ
jgi:ubiquinone/menaquinone biosynthesis C-methylase UbiE